MNRRVRGISLYSQAGQVLPLALICVTIASMLMLMLINTGNRAVEKSRVANVADSAALSGATYIAQHLNSMAYLNRAMAANHIGAGHMVAYVSWIRYVEDVMQKLDYLATVLPPLKNVTRALHRGAELIERLGESSGKGYLIQVDTLNQFYTAAQAEANLLFSGNVDLIMNQVADLSTGGTTNRVNLNHPALPDFLPEERTQIQAALAIQQVKLSTFLQMYGTTKCDERMRTLIETTYGASDQINQGSMSHDWLTDRSNRLPSAKKRGGNRHSADCSRMSWSASDTLKIRPSGYPDWVRVASGGASSSELHAGYRGIHGYTDLSNKNADHIVLPVIAAASISSGDIHSESAFGLDNGNHYGVTSLAIAQVEFVRPKYQFAPLDADEYANLFNPFWHARLVGNRISDLPVVSQTTSKWRD